VRPERLAIDSEAFRSRHQVLTSNSYRVSVTRSSAWRALRGPKRSTRPAYISTASLHGDRRIAAIIAGERERPAWLNDPKLEEWTALEFRHVKPPSDEDWHQ
jgi:hypothetical protein